MDKHNISPFIKSQFPSAYEEGGETFISFVEAYYEYLDSYYSKNKIAKDLVDIDTTLSQFVENFKNIYLKDFPIVASTDKKFLIKHIKDFYKSKGSEYSIKLLIRLLFNEEAEILNPSDDILKISDSLWYEPEYVEISRSSRTASFLNKEVYGTKSKAKAIVEGIVTKRINGKFIDVLYLSDIKGTFLKDDLITDDGSLKNCPQVLGSLTNITITNGGRNSKIGDIFEVNGGDGQLGIARVNSVLNATGRVNFNLVEGGFGFSNTSDTDIYISDGILTLNNHNLDHKLFYKVKQLVESINVMPYSNISNTIIGDYVVGYNPSGTAVSNGVVVGITNNGDDTASLNILVKQGSFGLEKSLVLSGGGTEVFEVGDIVEEESSVNLTLINNTAPLIGKRIEQYTEISLPEKTGSLTLSTNNANNFQLNEVVSYIVDNKDVITGVVSNIIGTNKLKLKNIILYNSPKTFVVGGSIVGSVSGTIATVSSYVKDQIPNLQTNKIQGYVYSGNGSLYSITESWGDFISGSSAKIYSNSSSNVVIGTVDVAAVEYVSRGAYAEVSNKNANSIFVYNINGVFNANKKIKNKKNTMYRTIVGSNIVSATDIRIKNRLISNSMITSYSNNSCVGIIVGQNSSSIGVHGNTNPYISSEDIVINGSTKTITELSASPSNLITISTKENTNYIVGDVISLNIDLQQNKEVKSFYGIYDIVQTPSTNSFVVQMGDIEGDVIRAGNYTLFDSNSKKTIKSYITITDNDGNDTETILYKSGQGAGANFEIGELEGEETVFVNSDFLKDKNVYDIPLLNVNVDGSQSGVGYVGSVDIINGGSGYANSATVSFTGGGYGNGLPENVASGYVTTDSNGKIIDVTIVNMGSGYYTKPSISLPATSGNVASLSVNMEYGYGFDKLPLGSIDNYISDLLTNKEMIIGKISSLSKINPGYDYDTDPFVLVYNSYIAGYDRTEVIRLETTGEQSYIIGETVYQTIPGDGSNVVMPKGVVSAISDDVVYLKKTSFNTSFTEGYSLVGSKSATSRMVINVSNVEGSEILGNNAYINADAISANGIVSEVEIIDSGFGYTNNSVVELYNKDLPFVVTGVIEVLKHGKSKGSWKTETSHLDSNSKLHDNYYYQEYSYEISSGQSLTKYENILKNIMHVAGTKMFGRVVKKSFNSIATITQNSGFGENGGFSSAYGSLLKRFFVNGNEGYLLWPYDNYYKNYKGTIQQDQVGGEVGAWRNSYKKTDSFRKNMLLWTEDFTNGVWEYTNMYFDGLHIKPTTFISGKYQIKQTFESKKNKNYTISFNANVNAIKRFTVQVTGEYIRSGYVTFDLDTNSVVAKSGGFVGVITDYNTYKKIVIKPNKNIKTTYYGDVNFTISLNGDNDYGIVNTTPNTNAYIKLSNIQVENGYESTKYQKITHGDEWDGIRFYQQNQFKKPLLGLAPVGGQKNLMLHSDNFNRFYWKTQNLLLDKRSKVLNLNSYNLKETKDKIAKKHTISRKIETEYFDNVGFIINANSSSRRYLKITIGNKNSVFDLYNITNVYNEFNDFVALRLNDKGDMIISVYDTSSQLLLNPNVELTFLNGSQKTDDTYIGDGVSNISILRCFVSNSGQNDYNPAYQKVTTEFNVTNRYDEELFYIHPNNENRYLELPDFSGSPDIVTYMLVGMKGNLIFTTDTILQNTNIMSNDVVKGIGGIVSLLLYNRIFTNEELDYIKDVYAMGGFDKNLYLNNTNYISPISSFYPTNCVIASDKITLNAATSNISKTIGEGLYKLKFNCDLYGTFTQLNIKTKNKNGEEFIVRSIPVNGMYVSFEDYVYFDYKNIIFEFKGSNGSYAIFSDYVMNKMVY